MASDWLIVDGYNVINAWKDLSVLAEESLEHAREKLLERLSSYGAFRAMRTVVVPRGHSHDDEERTVVVPNPQQLVDDPERTMVARPSPRRSIPATGTFSS